MIFVIINDIQQAVIFGLHKIWGSYFFSLISTRSTEIATIIFLLATFFVYNSKRLEYLYNKSYFFVYNIMRKRLSFNVDIIEDMKPRYIITNQHKYKNNTLYVYRISTYKTSQDQYNGQFRIFYNAITEYLLFFIIHLDENSQKIKIYSVLMFCIIMFLFYLSGSYYVFSKIYASVGFFQENFGVLLSFFLFVSSLVLSAFFFFTNNVIFHPNKYWINYIFKFFPQEILNEISEGKGISQDDKFNILRESFHFELKYDNIIYSTKDINVYYQSTGVFSNEKDQIKTYIKDVLIAIFAIILLETYLSIKNVTVDKVINPVYIKEHNATK